MTLRNWRNWAYGHDSRSTSAHQSVSFDDNRLFGAYNQDVFDVAKCRVPGCSSPGWGDTAYCNRHHPEPESFRSKMLEIMQDRTPEHWENSDWSYMDLSGLDLQNRDFHYCRFRGSNLRDTNFSGCRFAMCLFDDVTASKSLFRNTKMISVLAAGGIFEQADFTGSDLININFIGIQANQAIFDESDLFYSRFIGASLENARFRDCNLKRVDFTLASLDGINFDDSNAEEAYFTQGDVT